MKFLPNALILAACLHPSFIWAEGEMALSGPAAPVTITVLPGERQTFGGFGTSIANFNQYYGQLPKATRDELSKMIWQELNFKVLRLWMQTHEYAPAPGVRDLTFFQKAYLDSGIIKDAQRFGATTLLLAPDNIPEGMREKRADGTIWLKASENANYARVLADFIEQIKKEHGIEINVTGIQNEASDQERFAPEQMADVVALLRAELDRRGFKSVKIVASENASANEIFERELDALKANPQAWQSLAGISSHSYNMAATERASARITAPDGSNLREYWMTEAGANGHEEPGDIKRALNLSGRFLNDINHRVTHWIHFLAYENVRADDNATCILTFKNDPPQITKFLKYDTYRQLSRAFDIGNRLRHCQSSLEGEMEWTYGRKPRLTAAAGKNPDGSWTVGLVNYTAENFDDIQGWSKAEQEMNRSQGGYSPGQTLEVQVDIPELKETGSIEFKVQRTTAKSADQTFPSVMMKDGKITLSLHSLELVTLRSVVPEKK